MAKVSRLLVERLKSRGIRHVFGIPSIHNIGLYDALRDEPSIRHILCRHEGGAAHMADGYARAGKGPGVVIASTGPGVCYTAAPLLEALGSNSPIILITSNIESKRIGRGCGTLHEVSGQDEIFKGIVKGRFCVRDPMEAPSMLDRAFHTALSSRPGPVYLEIPTDFWDKDIPSDTVPTAVQEQPSSRPWLKEGLDRAVGLLLEAERPLVIAGAGALRAGIGPQVRRLCDALEAPLLTSAEAKGLVSEGESFVFGNAARRGVARRIIESGDLVLALGTRLRHCDFSRRGVEFPKLIHLDWDDSYANKNHRAEIVLTGDIRAISSALAEALEEGAARRRKAGWDLKSLREEMLLERGEISRDCKELLYVDAIRSAIPPDGALVIDNTILGYWAEYFYKALFPGSLVAAKGSSIIGFSFPAAAGLKLACPKRPVAALIGDGGFFYYSQEISTCLRHNIGLPVIVVNDGSFGMIGLLQRQIYKRGGYETDFVNPDLETYAASFGIPSVRVEGPAALSYALSEALSTGGMRLIELAASFKVSPFARY
jgi:acetolactate synthase-1/2/3 large subunit